MTSRESDLRWMDLCLELAERAGESGESPVGSIVVADGEPIGQAAEETRARLDPTAHAEVLAIRAACAARGSLDLGGATLYTTVEPCVSCAYAIRAAGIDRVVYGTTAGEVGSHGPESRHPFLMDGGFLGWGAPPDVTAGVREDEARALRARFRRRSSRGPLPS